ncbi:MAG: FAD-binding oxidoreductase, partial [Moraxellaceae bacterium]
KGVAIYNNTRVARFEEDATGTVVFTDQGSFKCKRLLLCTNAFIGELLPELNIIPGRGQVIVTSPIAGLKLLGTYHYQQGYYYFRNIDKRILFGGGRNIDFDTERTWDFGHTEAVKEKLLRYLNEVILPGQNIEVDYWWSGIMGFGNELSPIVKQLEPNTYCAVRCNGMGVAMGSLVGEEAAELLIKDI